MMLCISALEETRLEEALANTMLCDNTVDNILYEGEREVTDKITPEDRNFMKRAQDAAKNSKDDETKVRNKYFHCSIDLATFTTHRLVLS